MILFKTLESDSKVEGAGVSAISGNIPSSQDSGYNMIIMVRKPTPITNRHTTNLCAPEYMRRYFRMYGLGARHST